MGEKIKVIYEDDEMMVVDKPGDLVVTNEGRNFKKATLEDWLKSKRPNNLVRSGIVHRLDKGTSGLILIAKTLEALDYLKRQFRDRKVEKRYKALVGGELPREGEMKVPIGRSRFGFGKFGVDPDGKVAETRFWLISKYIKGTRVYSLVDINLMTGRTHQIRVHFSNLRWPLVGDVLYGGEKSRTERQFLHAYKISFTHQNGKLLSFESDLPDELIEVLSEYEKKD